MELQFSSELLNFPQRIDIEEEERDGETPNMVTQIRLTLDDDCDKDGAGSLPSTSSDCGVDSQYISVDGSRLTGSDSNLTDASGSSSRLVKGQAHSMVTFTGSRGRLLRQSGLAEPLNALYNLGHEDETQFQPLLGEPGVYYKVRLCSLIQFFPFQMLRICLLSVPHLFRCPAAPRRLTIPMNDGCILNLPF